jgi:hypothetical protein
MKSKSCLASAFKKDTSSNGSQMQPEQAHQLSTAFAFNPTIFPSAASSAKTQYSTRLFPTSTRKTFTSTPDSSTLESDAAAASRTALTTAVYWVFGSNELGERVSMASDSTKSEAADLEPVMRDANCSSETSQEVSKPTKLFSWAEH